MTVLGMQSVMCQWDIQVEVSRTYYYLCEDDLENLFLAHHWIYGFYLYIPSTQRQPVWP